MGYYMGGDYYSPRGDYYAAGGTTGGWGQTAGQVVRAVRRAARSPVGKAMGQQLVRTVSGRILRRRAGARGGLVGRRHHRMNPLNPRALRRAIRRTHSFARFARKVMTFQHHHKFKKGRWGGHRRKARA